MLYSYLAHMKQLLLLLQLMLALTTATQAQNELDSAYIRENYYKIERMIPMRDGVKLFTAIYIPKDKSEKHPILLNRTPYSVGPYGEDRFRPYWHSYQRLYFRENYIMVAQDVRGRYMSEGVFEDVRPFNPNKKSNTDIDEASDSYDTIDWLVKNIEGNNNRVGVFGISYPGFYSTMAALSGHPSLIAASPQAPVTEWFIGDDFHHNGAFMLLDAFSFYKQFGIPRPVPVKQYIGGYEIKGDDNYGFYLRTGALKNFATLIGDSVTFWKDLYAHPNYDAFWKARNARANVAGIKPAMLIVGGLFDAEDCFGAWRLYEAIEEKNPKTSFNKIVMGPWSHGQWSNSNGATHMGNAKFGQRTSDWYQNTIEVPFFNYHLKGKGDLSKLSEATIFLSGKNEWKTYESWPPADAKDRELFLQPGGGLGWTKPTAASSYSQYVSDPAHPVPYTEAVHMDRTAEYMTDDQRFASRRPDVLTFETPVLTEDLTVTGTVIADLKLILSTTDADLVVKIIDVFPDNYQDAGNKYPMGGYQMLVRGEIMRGKYRNSYENPQPFKPGKMDQVKFELPDISHCFKKGHKLMVQVQSSWFPLADRNPQQFMNIYEANDKDFVPSTIQLYHDAKNSSGIILPILDNR
jgi:putative CocE/NonD family hydrolase